VKASADHVAATSTELERIEDMPVGVGPKSSLWPHAVAVGGLTASMSFLTSLAVVYGRGPSHAWFVPFTVFAALCLVGVVVAAVGFGMVMRSASLGAREVPAYLIRVWRESANSWTMFLLGCVLTLPAAALHSPRLVGDPDSARLVASILYVQRNGVDYLVETQEVALPHLLLGPILRVGGISGLQVFNVLSVIVLAGVVGLILWRLTRSPLAVLAGVLALNALPPILDRAYRVPMYPTMLALGFLGVYLAHRAIVAETRSLRWRSAVLAGLCLVLALEAHQVGQLFLVVTCLLVVSAPPSLAVPGLARVFLVVAVLSIPRLVVNLTEGGLHSVLSNRVDYWVTKGYLQTIQVEFFYLPVRDDFGEYLTKVPRGVLNIWDVPGFLVLVFAFVGLVSMSPRVRRFAITCLCLFLAVALYRRLPFYTRYFSFLLVGSALAAGFAFAGFPIRNPRVRRVAVGVGLAGLLAGVVLNYHGTIEKLQTLERTIARGPYVRFADEIPPGGGVIGTRSVYLNVASTDKRTYGGQFLTEREYATFLTWPSDDAVVDLMRRHDIEWVLVPEKPSKWVVRYNDIWLLPNYGKPARYQDAVRRSPEFCLMAKSRGAALYKLDPSGAPGSDGGPQQRICEGSVSEPTG
jgi:hypothetical protein